jgi:hypothetical protein
MAQPSAPQQSGTTSTQAPKPQQQQGQTPASTQQQGQTIFRDWASI